MKKLIFIILILLFSALLNQFVYSQFVLNSFYNPVTGDTLKSKSVDTVGIYPGPGGENQTWNFSNAVILEELFTEAYLVPSAAPHFTQFPGCNAASINSNTPPIYHYYQNGDSGSFLLGYVLTNTFLRYYIPLPRMPYPISFGTQLNKSYYGVSSWGNITKHFHGTRTFTGDGYGTLILPTGTFSNVLRIKTVDVVYDTTFSGGVVVATSHEVVTYFQWYRAGFKFPVFSIVEIVPSQNPPWKVVVIGDKNVPIGLIQISNRIPSAHQLFQNYPNPFNSKTKIRFDVSSISQVKITVYGVNGNEVDILVNNTLPAGTYSVNFDAGSYASGIYYYRIVTENYSSTGKMVLLK